MLKIIYLFTMLFSASFVYSAILTVNNNTTSPGQYASLQLAIDDAFTGDTILIHRSPISYGNVLLNKKLILIGEGALPDKVPNSITLVGTLTMTYSPLTNLNASKSQLIGISITSLLVNEKDATMLNSVDSLVIKYCKLAGLTFKNKVVNVSVMNSMIGSINNGYLFNCIFKNNIIGTFNATPSSGDQSLIMNNIIQNRIVLKGAIVANNIMYNTSSTLFHNGGVSCQFVNNLLYGTVTTFNPADYTTNGNISMGNIFNLDPMFINPVTYSTLSTYTHLVPTSTGGPFANFHLQPGSPAIGAGSDATDLGIYGGETPWRDGSTTDSRYRYYPFPDAVPVITNLSISTPLVNAGGILQFQLDATTHP